MPAGFSSKEVKVLVLVVSHFINEKLCRVLYDTKCRVEISCNFTRAFERIKHQNIDIVLFDCTYPDIDPLEFVFNVRDIDGHVSIVFLHYAQDTRTAGFLHQYHNLFYIPVMNSSGLEYLKSILSS